MVSGESSDYLLLRRVAEGDVAALGALYDRHAPQVYGLTQAILGPGDAAADAVQETFLYAWRRADRHLPEQGTVRTWLLLHARELALEAVRDGQQGPDHTPPPLLDPAWEAPRFRGAPSMWDPDSGGERVQVLQALAGLTARERRLLDLAFLAATPQALQARREQVPLEALQAELRAVARTLHQALPGAGR